MKPEQFFSIDKETLMEGDLYNIPNSQHQSIFYYFLLFFKKHLFLVAILLFGIGDVLTTELFLFYGIAEYNPAIQYVYTIAGLYSFILFKLIVLYLAYNISNSLAQNPGAKKYASYPYIFLIVLGLQAVVLNILVVIPLL